MPIIYAIFTNRAMIVARHLIILFYKINNNLIKNIFIEYQPLFF